MGRLDSRDHNQFPVLHFDLFLAHGLLGMSLTQIIALDFYQGRTCAKREGDLPSRQASMERRSLQRGGLFDAEGDHLGSKCDGVSPIDFTGAVGHGVDRNMTHKLSDSSHKMHDSSCEP